MTVLMGRSGLYRDLVGSGAFSLTSIVLQSIDRRDSWRLMATLAWAALDVGFPTLIRWPLDCLDSSVVVSPLMIARQVKRLLVLSSYYENRIPS